VAVARVRPPPVSPERTTRGALLFCFVAGDK
jgi:hypothetical protein